MANGNAYPAILLDAKGKQTDGGVAAIQFTDGNDQPAGPGGGSGSGNAVVRGPYSFAYNTANINNGVTFYTPTVNDVLLGAWVEVDTAFDGTTPLFDFGAFVSGVTSGFFGLMTQPPSLGQIDQDINGASNHQGLLQHLSGTNTDLYISGLISVGAVNFAGANLLRAFPAKITAANPWKAVVSQDGTIGGAAVGGTAGAGRLYVVTATPTAFT